MQRVSPKALLLGIAIPGVLLAGLLVVFMLMGSNGTPKASAAFTPTNTPVGTPKPAGTAPVGGLTDLLIPGLYECISNTTANATSLEVKSAVQCYTLFDTGGGTAGEPPCGAWHGPGPQGANPVVATVLGEGNCAGHVGPPPYSILAPTKGHGAYTAAAGGSVRVVSCFEDLGASILGPNAIAELTYTGADAFQAAANGTMIVGSVNLWTGQTNAACTTAETGPAYAVPGTLPGVLAINITKRAASRDFDGDGCTDVDELYEGKQGTTAKCGDDPWNPFDATSGSPMDVSGSYDLVARLLRNDTGAPGFYYNCKADIQQATKNLTARILCYIDSTGIAVNPQVMAGTAGATCVTQPKFCGDGAGGSAPPGCTSGRVDMGTNFTCAPRAGQGAGCTSLPCDVSQYQFSDVDTKHTVLTGVLNNTSNTIQLAGCFEDLDMTGALGNVYASAKIDAHTGIGTANVFSAQSAANCNGGTPTGVASVVQLTAVRQAPGNKAGGCVPLGGVGYTGCRDSDGDGCPDKRELEDNQLTGGLRDPDNRFDYFNPEKASTPHAQTIADILKVVQQFGKNQGNAAYTIDTDRTALLGGNVWNLGPPDGQQTVADILAAVKQYAHNC